MCVRFLAYYAQLSEIGYFIVKCSWDQRSNQKKKYLFLSERSKGTYLLSTSNLFRTEQRNHLEERMGRWNEFFSHGTNHSKGVCIIVNPSFQYQVEHSYSDNFRRIVLIAIILDSQKLSLCNICAPNNQTNQREFIQELNNCISC